MIDRLADDEVLRAVTIIAEADGVSLAEVGRRGIRDLAARMALIQRRLAKEAS